MTSKLTGQIVRLERRTTPVDLERWLNAPVRIRPDWVLISQILDRLVSPEEADRLNKDDGFWGEVEAVAAPLDEG